MNNSRTANDQIRSLSNEAAEAGDLDMVAICEKALLGNIECRSECLKVINAASANSGEAYGVQQMHMAGHLDD